MAKAEYMKAITQGVYVIGVKTKEVKNFMTAAWLTQISSLPNTILVAVASFHYTTELMKNSKACVISILAEGQEDIAKDCGFVSGRRKNKTDCDYYMEYGQLPAVKDAAAHLLCNVVQVIDNKDHQLFVCEVTDGTLTEQKPLVYDSEKYFG